MMLPILSGNLYVGEPYVTLFYVANSLTYFRESDEFNLTLSFWLNQQAYENEETPFIESFSVNLNQKSQKLQAFIEELCSSEVRNALAGS